MKKTVTRDPSFRIMVANQPQQSTVQDVVHFYNVLELISSKLTFRDIFHFALALPHRNVRRIVRKRSSDLGIYARGLTTTDVGFSSISHEETEGWDFSSPLTFADTIDFVYWDAQFGIPEGIGSFTKLKKLELAENTKHIRSVRDLQVEKGLPSDMMWSRTLKEISFDRVTIRHFPKTAGELPQLTILRFSKCPLLCTLPNWIPRLSKKLERVVLYECPELRELPLEYYDRVQKGRLSARCNELLGLATYIQGGATDTQFLRTLQIMSMPEVMIQNLRSDMLNQLNLQSICCLQVLFPIRCHSDLQQQAKILCSHPFKGLFFQFLLHLGD